MAKPAILNIDIVRGEDFPLAFTVKVDDVIQDFTGATVQAQIRETPERTGVLIADFVGSVAADNQTIQVTMDDATTAGIVQDTGYYDVLVTTLAGEDRYYLKGRVTIDGSVTVKA